MPDPLAPASVTLVTPLDGCRLAKPECDPETSTGPGHFSLQAPPCRVHDLKCWPPHWADIHTGRKTYELRQDDRGYRVGDVLLLREWDSGMRCADIGPDGSYTGRICQREITHILRGGQFGLAEGYVALSLAVTR